MAQRIIYGTVEDVRTTADGERVARVHTVTGASDYVVSRTYRGAAPDDGKVYAYRITGTGRLGGVDVSATYAYRRLVDTFPRESEVATMVTRVSASGMSRHIRVLGVDDDRRIDDVSLAVARVLGWKVSRDGAVVVSGAGMDMGFHIVYTLAGKLYGDGYALNHRGL